MDMSQYLDMFLEESLENLQNLNENLLELEKNPGDKETINSVFRVAHTLKGMAGSMGFTNIAELTHDMENILDKFKNDEIKITSDVITVLFKCLDALEKMVDSIRTGSKDEIEIGTLVQMLRNIGINNATNEKAKSNTVRLNTELNVYELNLVKEAKNREYNVYNVDVELYKDTLLKSARAYLVHKTLEEVGEIIKTVPCIEDLENEIFDFSFSIVLITKKTSEEIVKLVEGISEIQKVEVKEVSYGLKDKSDNHLNSDNEVAVGLAGLNETKSVKDDEKGQKKSHQSVRVDLERLDSFMNLVGELVIHRTRLEQLSGAHKLNDLNETLEQVGRITFDLQDLVMKVRMLPVERVFNRFPRMVRDLAQELNKDIDLVIEGENTELDRTVIDELGEPLVHLIRNAADHGLESPEERIKKGKNSKGTIRLVAYQEGNKAVIKVEDDGKGLNIEKIRKKAQVSGIATDGMSDIDIKNLIFMSGLSTSDKVTDVSGRGVGMDVVKTKISSLGGTIDVLSEVDRGTTVIIRLPLTLSIIQTLLVKVGGETFAISLGFIDRVIDMNVKDIRLTNNKEVIIYRDSVIPLVRVARKLNLEEDANKDKYVVIVKVGEKTMGLLVDSLFGQQEIVIKPMGKVLQGLKEYVGATILGDGLVTLILDVAALV